MPQVTLNGKPLFIAPDRAGVRELIEDLGLADRRVAVEINRAIVPRAAHATTRLGEDDVIEIIHLVGGG